MKVLVTRISRTTSNNMNAERTSSFDIGYETYFNSLDLGFNITYFDIEIEDPLMGSNCRLHTRKCCWWKKY